MIDQKPFEGDTFIYDELLKLKKQFNLINCVETGTQYGTTTKELWKIFEKVNTIEVDEKYFELAKENLKGFDVGMWLGNSKTIVGQFGLERCLFYLDAHGCEVGGCPLKEELETIASMNISLVCIAIHDFKVPGKDFGFDTYDYELCFEEIEPYLNKIYKDGFDYHYNQEADGAKRGVIYIYPANESSIGIF